MRRRLDAEMVRRGIASSRAQAVESIARGAVLVRGAVADKAARMVDESEPIVIVADGPRFVSRGGHKLEAALERFAVDVTGLTVLDVGASTGGFTDCVLQRGASAVIAVDVGVGQLHERLRADPRVEVYERCNVRTDALASVLHGRRLRLTVGDLSFISLRAVVPSLVAAATPAGTLVLLVKPQFEAGRSDVARGRGVVRDPEIWRRVITEVGDAFQLGGAGMMAVMPSPITGADGNVEFLARFDVGRSAGDDRSLIIDAVVREAVDSHGPPATPDSRGPESVRGSDASAELGASS